MAPGRAQVLLQLSRVKYFAAKQPAVRQAQVQQARTALGVVYLQRVLQDQHFHLVLNTADPATNAGVLRAQAVRTA